MSRQSLLLGSFAAILSLGSVASPAAGQALTTELVADGFAAPLYAVSPPGDLDRLFVVEQNTARIRIIELATGNVLGTPFIDLNSVASSGGERGLLGLAFHPFYANNGRFFVNYTANTGATVVAEYARSMADPNIADPNAVQTIFTISQPFSNHNGGCIQFGPDGKLYVGTGDGGSGNDPGNRAQNPLNNLGKMLRFDVDLAAPFIPANNPFVNDPGTNDEIWALGLRNPWRFSFDRANGDLYIADVGQFAWEEIDWVAGTSTGGENYGWRCMEGNACTGLSGCVCNAPVLTDPVRVYGHGSGCSVTGGYAYCGPAMPGLQGTYFYGDYCSRRIWSFRMVNGVLTDHMERTAELDPPNGFIGSITSFGEDGAGEMYIVAQNGQIWRIVEDCTPPPATNYCVTSPNATGPGAMIGASGSQFVANNNFNLVVQSGNPGSFGIFIYGFGATQAPFGNGFLCIDNAGGGPFRLYPAVQMDPLFATGAYHFDFTALPAMHLLAAEEGDTFHFQFWYRDHGGPGGDTFNWSDALTATFCP